MTAMRETGKPARAGFPINDAMKAALKAARVGINELALAESLRLTGGRRWRDVLNQIDRALALAEEA